MRDCGACRVCCVLPEVAELGKPRKTACQHLSMDPGCRSACRIYEQRPRACSDFRCAWLNGLLPAWARPDKVGVMVTENKTEDGRVVFCVWETKKDAAVKGKIARVLASSTVPLVRMEDLDAGTLE